MSVCAPICILVKLWIHLHKCLWEGWAKGAFTRRNIVACNIVARNNVACNNVARNNVARNIVARNNVACETTRRWAICAAP